MSFHQSKSFKEQFDVSVILGLFRNTLSLFPLFPVFLEAAQIRYRGGAIRAIARLFVLAL
jgi:hypothetical protein